MHEHLPPTICAHELKHCSHCDVVYCEKCKHEWKTPSAMGTFPNYPPGVRRADPWTTRQHEQWNREDQEATRRKYQSLIGDGAVLCSHAQ
jgi:hypothetical protein